MALIQDPDLLRLSSASAGGAADGEVFIDKNALTIELLSTTEFGSSNFSPSDGVTLQALYSFLKEQWKNNDVQDFYNFRFPMEAITAEQFEFTNDWKPSSDTVRSYIRTGGWEEKDPSGSSRQAWAGVITLGNIESNQTAYYFWQDGTGSALEATFNSFTYNGPVNEAVKIFGDANNGNFNYRTGRDLVVRIRPAPTGTSGNVTGYTFGSSDTNAIGTPLSVTNQVYRFPLATAVDLKITKTDAESAALETSTGYELKFDQPSLSSSILTTDLTGGPFNFTHLIDSTSVTNLSPSDIYNITQYKLRQGTGVDIDDDGTGVRRGVLTENLLVFVGDQLQTLAINGGTEGILINDLDQGNLANFALRDNSNTLQSFPAIASGTLTFSTTLQDDPSTRYWMFFQSASVAGVGAAAWPGPNAVIVDDNSGADISGYYHLANAATYSSNTAIGAITSGTKVLTTSADMTGSAATANGVAGDVLYLKTGNNIGFYFIATNTASSITIAGDKNFENTDAGNTVTFDIYPKNTGTVPWTFDYTGTGNRNDGKNGTDAPIQLVSLGLDNAQYVTTTGTIQSTTGQNFTITAPLERNYNDPDTA